MLTTLSDWIDRRVAPPPPPWGGAGDDLSVEPIFLSAAGGWDDAEHDDLVYLRSSLTRSVTRERQEVLVEITRSALRARLHMLAARMGSADLSERLIKVLSHGDLLLRHLGQAEPQDRMRFYFDGGARQRRAREAHKRLLVPARDYLWQEELAVLQALLRLADGAAGERCDEMTMADAVRASLFSGVNAAYVMERFTATHELLTVSAWLGYLARGRAAYMPVALAGRMAEQFDPARELGADTSGNADRVMSLYAKLTLGSYNLWHSALRVAASSQTECLSPGDPPGLPRCGARL